MFFSTPYFSATFLLEMPFSKSLKAWHFSAKVLTANFLLTAMLKQQKNVVKKYNHCSNIPIQKFEQKFKITSKKQFKRLNNWFEIVKVRDNGVQDNACFLA